MLSQVEIDNFFVKSDRGLLSTYKSLGFSIIDGIYDNYKANRIVDKIDREQKSVKKMFLEEVLSEKGDEYNRIFTDIKSKLKIDSPIKNEIVAKYLTLIILRGLERGFNNITSNLSEFQDLFDEMQQELKQKEQEIHKWIIDNCVRGPIFAGEIRSKYKALAVKRCIERGEKFDDFDFPENLKNTMESELKSLDETFTINGVHYLKCQFNEIFDADKAGERIEIEAFGPYLKDYLSQLFGSYENIELEKMDEIGLNIMGYLKKVFPNMHAVSLYDEYNLGISAYGFNGTPINRDSVHAQTQGNKGQLSVESDIYGKEFKKFVEFMLRKYGAILPGEQEGVDKNYVLVSETDKIESAKVLVEKLRERGLIYENGNEIWFKNTIDKCEDPRYLNILLRDASGKRQCAALDASGFLDKRNRDITHLVILPREIFEEQQDMVWELVRTLGIEPKKYHNIFFDVEDDKVNVESVLEVFRKIFGLYNPTA